MLTEDGDDIKMRRRPMRLRGSDARMSGCELPVVILRLQAIRGITASLPVIRYSRHIGATENEDVSGSCSIRPCHSAPEDRDRPPFGVLRHRQRRRGSRGRDRLFCLAPEWKGLHAQSAMPWPFCPAPSATVRRPPARLKSLWPWTRVLRATRCLRTTTIFRGRRDRRDGCGGLHRLRGPPGIQGNAGDRPCHTGNYDQVLNTPANVFRSWRRRGVAQRLRIITKHVWE